MRITQRKYRIRAKKRGRKGSQPISRVLSRTVIPLGVELPRRSSDLPEGSASHAVALYAVLLRMGFTLPRMLPCARCALTAPFHHCRAYTVQIRKGDSQHMAATFRLLRCKTVSPCGDTIRCTRSAVCFLWHFPSSHDARSLTGILLCGARTFLCVLLTRSDCLADFPVGRVARDGKFRHHPDFSFDVTSRQRDMSLRSRPDEPVAASACYSHAATVWLTSPWVE